MEDVRGFAERQMFRLLRMTFPTANVTHEIVGMQITNPDGTTNSTIPDFCVKPINGPRLFVEMTTAYRNSGRDGGDSNSQHLDIKRRQKEIMKQAAPKGDIYVVFYGEDLWRMQEQCPGICFFENNKKSR